ncbi:MAG: HD domain-containing phosphohydrolase [Lachnospiraceae bacterium]|nr:HD domain-containing phosphohydrolase [Lachnospiraceae bacterium]
MKVDWIDILCAFSEGLDFAEENLCKVSSGHAMRVAYFSALAGKKYGMGSKELSDLVACALLHDNALTQYVAKEKIKSCVDMNKFSDFGMHCIEGGKNIKELPFYYDSCKDFILYHHENADGTGIFGKKTEEVPFGAQLIHMADHLEVTFDVLSPEIKQEKINEYVRKNRGTLFSPLCVDLFFETTNEKLIKEIASDNLMDKLKGLCNLGMRELDAKELYSIGTVFARIIDFKSSFTNRHSLGIAEKAANMGSYYGYDEETCAKLYLAGCVHDIGKLLVLDKVLEKEDKLTDNEYQQIQTHVDGSIILLEKIKGLEEVTKWAVRHHEKLDGSGYPRKLSAKDLDFNDRLMACIDTYQALTEERPYKKSLPHNKAILIMEKMVYSGKLDGKITEDLNKVFKDR